MPRFTLELNQDQAAFRPGEMIEGVVGWELDDSPKWVEVRLFWHTQGKGTVDVVIAESQRFENPSPVDAQVFSFTAPDGPFSYQGTLIEVMWSIEVVAHRVKETAVIDLTLSATGESVRT